MGEIGILGESLRYGSENPKSPAFFSYTGDIMKRLAVVGTGNMARLRTKAFLSLDSAVELCGVASRRLENARAFAEDFGCKNYTDIYQELAECKPDVLLVEVPHEVQDEIVLWSLEAGLHTLVGGCLASRAETAAQITALSQSKDLVVEAGYEARYKEVWELTKKWLEEETIGTLVAVRSVALYAAPPESWYYDEQKSGGMILTHMSYAFINPVRWLLGNPHSISAFANRKHQTGHGKVKQEMCSANFMFANDVICNMVAGYVKPKQLNAWQLSFIGTQGSLEVYPGDLDAGSLTLYSNKQTVLSHHFQDNLAFVKQAQTFLTAIDTGQPCLNPAADAMIDVQLSELIVNSIETGATLQVS